MEAEYITRAEHNEYVKRMEDEHKRLNNRLITVENATKDMHELIKNVGIMATNMEHMVDEQRSQSERLQRLEEMPLDSWNTVKSGAYNAIGASIGGAIIAAILFFL
ncbi:MAG: hypothetical protein IJO20_01675 [Ruminococcus sp.]|nr:hypothetical protein [Ruminococcus sp.]MBQ7133186.1 hypothetical protein [Ruminococcus sp.]